ncbi:MAG: rRNA maturation RNase YbeY [Planctomycetes bacterium]|nr:rRNA maturation RNase YbeY [Planctomycetota bacterium]
MSARRADIQVTLAAPSPVKVAAIRRIASLVLQDQRRTSSLHIVVVDDRAIRRLNRRHLGHDRTTDVIAFPLDGSTAPLSASSALLGEVYVSATTARREARRRGLPAREELIRYVIHGILHLCGYDDHRPADRKEMWARQERLVGRSLPHGKAGTGIDRCARVRGSRRQSIPG